MEDIRERESGGEGRLGGLVLASLGGACVVFAAVALTRRPSPPPKPAVTALDALVAAAPSAGAPSRDVFGARDVTFPAILSDDPRPTTALAALGSARAPGDAAADPPSPPPATDRLVVVPLPAQGLVGASPVVTNPRDPLTQAAVEASSPKSGVLAEEGHPGAFLLQVSSFRTEPEATSFATALRERGHRAYVEAAQIIGRGTWYRVRVGPFHSAHEAAQYRGDFERREHLVPFMVEPEKEKRLTEAREAERRSRETARRR